MKKWLCSLLLLAVGYSFTSVSVHKAGGCQAALTRYQNRVERQMCRRGYVHPIQGYGLVRRAGIDYIPRSWMHVVELPDGRGKGMWQSPTIFRDHWFYTIGSPYEKPFRYYKVPKQVPFYVPPELPPPAPTAAGAQPLPGLESTLAPELLSEPPQPVQEESISNHQP